MKIFFELSHDLLESSQSLVTRTVKSLRVIGMQARVNVESNKVPHFSCLLLLRNGAQSTMKWHPISLLHLSTPFLLHCLSCHETYRIG